MGIPIVSQVFTFIYNIFNVIRSLFYDWLFKPSNPVSTQWGYYEILKLLPDNITILDVGVGDGIYFTNNKVNQLIKQKNIKIKGIDVDIGSIKVCQKRIIKYGLQNHVEAECISLFDIKKKYDYILFMESFPVISNELFIDFILHAKTLVKDGCQDRIKLYHNLIEKHEYTKGREFFKKTILHIITLNDFGKLTTRDKMEEILVEHCQVDRSKINMQVLLECTYKEMSGVFFCIPVLRNKVIRQYLISL